ncbi:hypothetical protein SEPCBS57363_002824 [Sporothrix epigloea]|uniref:Uncharacterized protein n=1 Tax=Sporothrix epigloea TaxID=1892477 RepID=A0ABP0DI34_9PEZI
MVRGDDGFGSLLKASNYLSLISGFFEQLATIYTLGAMLEIGLDLLYMQKTVRGYSGEFKDNFRENAHTTWASIGDNSDQRDHKRMARLAATVVGLFLLVLAVAVLCKACDGYALYNQGSLNGSETGVEANVDGLDFAVIVDRYIAAIHTARELTASFDFCVWILVLLLMGLVCSIVNQARLEINNSSLNATFLLLAATLLCLARFTWHLFYNIMWLLPSSSSGAPIWFDAVDPVLNAWLFFVALVLLHAVVTSPICGP